MSTQSQSRVSAERPFPGLRPFAYLDHEFFFGREEQSFALYRLIDRHNFIAVVGSSGSGKSSLVRAGLLPLLDSETRDTGGRTWLWREIRPGDAPLRRLTGSLASLSNDEDPIIASARRARIAAHLQRSSYGVADALAEVELAADTSFVLLVDQFEELFRFSAGSSRGTSNGGDAQARDEAAQFVQLLLEAVRDRSHKVHVMLTMRSDFIGDCSRFHGLPEAVSATQFLVPALTRDQLEEVVRKPIEKAGATIAPELVERLLNDCSMELDQLPVLQHCLLRLWEEGGRRAEPGAPRTVTIDHYRNIGGFADALSRHADEIVKDLSGPNLGHAVEQTFRALSELDKEGRAIRRALKFRQLLAETGVDAAAVRQVVDRFRGDDCSFLVPPAFETPVIEDSTRIDVGHEALLRRWERMSGRGADIGWLRAEQVAGERYRGLLAMAEGDTAVLPSHLVDERWAWWKARPRTPAWAERYGGGFDRVERLLRRSQRRQLFKRVATAATVVLAIATAAVMFYLRQEAVRAEMAAVQAEKTLFENLIARLKDTKESISRLVDYLNDGTISVKGAQEFLNLAQQTLTELERNPRVQSPETAAVMASVLLYISDTRAVLGENAQALSLAQQARETIRPWSARDPDNSNLKLLTFAGAFRIGDAVANMSGGRNKDAIDAYQEALGIARQLATRDPENIARQRNLAFIINKIGDLYQEEKNWTAAIDQYRQSLAIAERLALGHPERLFDVATSRARIGQVLAAKDDYAGAMSEYRAALAIQVRLLEDSPDSDTLWSNRATSHRRIGEVFKAEEKYDDAQKAFQEAADIRAKLFRKDPGNALWRSGLATDRVFVGDVLMLKRDWPKAAENYSAALQLREDLVFRDPGNGGWQRNLAAVRNKLGDALAAQGNVADAQEHYGKAADIYRRLVATPSSRSTDRINLFANRLKAGDLWFRQDKREDALSAFRSALAVADQVAAAAPGSAAWQLRLASAHEKIGDILAATDETRKDAVVEHQKALAILDAVAAKESNNSTLPGRQQAIRAKLETLGMALEKSDQ